MFLPGVVTDMRSCSVRVKMLVKVGLSEGGVSNVIVKKMLC